MGGNGCVSDRMSTKTKTGLRTAEGQAPVGGAKWWHALLILVAGISVYAPSLRNGFTNWDDQEYITDNRDLSDASLGCVA